MKKTDTILNIEIVQQNGVLVHLDYKNLRLAVQLRNAYYSSVCLLSLSHDILTTPQNHDRLSLMLHDYSKTLTN